MLLAAGRLLAAQDPTVWRRLLASHVADADGRCRTCRPASGPAPVWPCRLAVVADEARRVREGRSASGATG